MSKGNDISKLPPQAIDMEKAVLGAIMLESDCMSVLSEILLVESFYEFKHKMVFSCILKLFNTQTPIDILTVTQELKKRDQLDSVGGAYFVTHLTNRMASSANVEFHARIIQQKFIQREIIKISTRAIQEAYSDGSDCFDLLEGIESSLTTINKYFEVGKIQHINELWIEVAEHNNAILKKKGVSGVPSGYDVVDSVTGGWQAPDLIIIAARPAMGKTSLACNFARNASVRFGRPGVIFSLEMSSRQLATRIFSLESDVNISEFSRRGVSMDQMITIQNDCGKLLNCELYIDDTPALSLSELRSKARKMKREKKIEYIVVDYLQLMTVGKNEGKGNREQEISTISRGLKALAKELQMPIIALSQLSRAVETRGGDKRPQLSDLRESGAIEQDADMVLFIHRPEYYGITEYADGTSAREVAEIIFAKNRNGPVGTEKLRFIDRQTKFTDLTFKHIPSINEDQF